MNLRITLVFLFITNFLFSQEKEFEGIIQYKVEAKNPNKNIMSDSLWEARTKSIQNNKIFEYYYKKDNYKNIIKGEGIQVYNPKTNIIYNYKIGKDTVFNNILKANKSIDPIKEVIRSKDTKVILGYECEKIILKSKLAETTYYYSKSLKIPAKNFENHHYGNWYEYLKETNSLPLKIIIKNNILLLEMTAINVDRKELPSSDFKLGNLPNK